MDEALRALERAIVGEGGLPADQLERLGRGLERLGRYEELRRQGLNGHRARSAAGISRREMQVVRALRTRALNGALRTRHVRMASMLARAGRVPPAFVAYLANPAVIAGILIIAAVGVGLYLHYSSENPEERVASAIDCDCGNIKAGILNVGWIPHCRAHEQKLRDLAATGQLNIQIDDDGIIAGGDVCGWPDNGPSAWPVVGASGTPPKAQRPQKDCTWFTGLMRACGD